MTRLQKINSLLLVRTFFCFSFILYYRKSKIDPKLLYIQLTVKFLASSLLLKLQNEYPRIPCFSAAWDSTSQPVRQIYMNLNTSFWFHLKSFKTFCDHFTRSTFLLVVLLLTSTSQRVPMNEKKANWSIFCVILAELNKGILRKWFFKIFFPYGPIWISTILGQFKPCIIRF